VGRYRLVRRLGEGGMGQVWEGNDETLGRPVAVKLISVLAGGGSRGEEMRARFLREARITAALQHPNIVTLHDLGEAEAEGGTTPFLVMERLRGEGLDGVLRRGPVTLTAAVRWGTQICDALGEAHVNGILHRDIKPANIVITTSGLVKVLDFGIARAADPSATDDRLTQTGFMVGTPQYMAPEQARGKPEPRSDLYALGCVLFEMITGRLPFLGSDALSYLSAHLMEEPPMPSSVAPGIPGEWDSAVLRLLRKEPAERYRSASAVARELRRLKRGEGLEPARSAGYTSTVVSGTASPDTRLTQSPGQFRATHMRTVTIGQAVVDVAFSPEGDRLLLTLGRETVLMTDLAGREQLRLELPRHPSGGGQAAAAISPKGACLVTVSPDNKTLCSWDVSNGSELWRAVERLAIGKPTFSPDGTVLATANADNTIRLRDPSTGEVLTELRTEGGGLPCAAFSPDGNLLATTVSIDEVALFRTVRGDERAVLQIQPSRAGWVTSVAFSPDGSRLATSHSPLLDGYRGDTYVWSTSTGTRMLRVGCGKALRTGARRWPGNHVAFSKRGDVFATAEGDSTARLWAANTGEELLAITHDKEVNGVALSRDGGLLATASQDGTVQLWQFTA
jgi:serine/threonine protein kinase